MLFIKIFHQFRTSSDNFSALGHKFHGRVLKAALYACKGKFWREKTVFSKTLGHWLKNIFWESVSFWENVISFWFSGIEWQCSIFLLKKFKEYERRILRVQRINLEERNSIEKWNFLCFFGLSAKNFILLTEDFWPGLSQLFFACREEQFEDFLYEKFFFLSFLDNEWKLLALYSKTVRHDQKISAVWPKFFVTQVKTAFYVSI